MVASKLGVALAFLGAAVATNTTLDVLEDEGLQLLQLGAEKKAHATKEEASPQCKEARQTLSAAKTTFREAHSAKVEATVAVEEGCPEAEGKEPHLVDHDAGEQADPRGAKLLTAIGGCAKGWFADAQPEGGTKVNLGNALTSEECIHRCNYYYQEIGGFTPKTSRWMGGNKYEHKDWTSNGKRTSWKYFCVWDKILSGDVWKRDGGRITSLRGTVCAAAEHVEQIYLKNPGVGQFMMCAIDPLMEDYADYPPYFLEGGGGWKPKEQIVQHGGDLSEWWSRAPFS